MSAPRSRASLLAHVGGHKARAGFLVTLTAWFLAAGAYYLTQLRPYFGRPIAYVQTLEPLQLAAFALAAARGVRPDLGEPAATSVAQAIRVCLADRADRDRDDRRPPTRSSCASRAAGWLPHDAHAVRMFADLYFTRIAFVLALIGYALVVWRSFWRAPALILMITTLAVFFFYKMRIWPEQFWLARRFLTEILPGALIFASAAIFAPVWMARRWSARVEVSPDPVYGDRNHRHGPARLPIPLRVASRFEDTSSTRT